jgi:cell division protein FtsQ
MTTMQKTSRVNFVRQRRTSKTRSPRAPQRTEQTARKAYHPASVYLPVKPQMTSRRTPGRTTRNTQQKGYDIAFTVGRTKVHAPGLNLPQLGPRFISTALTMLLGCFLYIMWTASPFMIKDADVRGNQRLSAVEINSMLGVIGQPIIKASPSQIEANLQTAFPDLESVKVQALFPNRIMVNVVERRPIVAWYQDGAVTWIDANGIAFTPRGDVPGLIQVSASGTPAQTLPDPTLSPQEQEFITPDMVQALITLAPDVPAGMPMIFDPLYGMGWQDPRGWTAYFGQNAKDISLKKMVYNAILDTLTLQGVQPSLVSVEFLNAPFYK